jgi:chloride channel protein, CIC family
MQSESNRKTPLYPTETQNELKSEIQEEIVIRQQRRRLFPRAALVGMIAGLISALFRAMLAGADTLRGSLISWAQHFPRWGWIFPVLFSVTGAVLSIFLVVRYAPEASGSGIPHLKGVMHRLRTLNWKRILPVKFFSGVLAIGGGLAMGREGPSVQMGGAVGDAVSNLFKVTEPERRTMIAAGAGAGLAAAFNAPLAGVMFVLEEIQRDFHPYVFGAAFLAAAIADIVVRLLSGAFPVFSIPDYPTPPIASLPIFAILGILAGLLGVAFNRSLIGALDLFKRLKGRWILVGGAAVGAFVGLVSWFSPLAVGGGHSLAEVALAGNIALAALPLLFLGRFVMTVSSYGSGAVGGIFAPLLALGALLGLGIGQLAHGIAPVVVPDAAVFAVVGMAAYFTAIVRAPLTGVVLIVEMTGNYQQMLPLLVCCFCAYAVAELMKDEPIYEALLERDLVRDGSHLALKEPTVLDFIIQQDAHFAGREVQYLGLPPGCVLIRCTENGHEFVPTAVTRLQAHMRITAVIAPSAANAIDLLREGCESPIYTE